MYNTLTNNIHYKKIDKLNEEIMNFLGMDYFEPIFR